MKRPVDKPRDVMPTNQSEFGPAKTGPPLSPPQVSLGRVPQSTDHFEWHGLRFEVMDMDGRRVDKVLVTTLPPRPAA